MYGEVQTLPAKALPEARPYVTPPPEDALMVIKAEAKLAAWLYPCIWLAGAGATLLYKLTSGT